MSRIEEDDKLLNLVITTQQLNRKINSPFTDHHVQWGNLSTLMTYQSPSVSRIVK